MTSYEEFQKFEASVMGRKMDANRRIREEGQRYLTRKRSANTFIGRFLDGRHPLPGSDFTTEEVFSLYGDIEDALDEHGEEYGREFETGGFPFVREGSLGLDGPRKVAGSYEEFLDIAEEGFEHFEPYSRTAPINTENDSIDGRVEYEAKTHYRGAIVPGSVAVKLFLDPEVPEAEEEDLGQSLEEALSGPIRL